MSYNSSVNSIISSNSNSINVKEKLNQCKVLFNMGFALIPLAPKSKKPFSPLLPEVDGEKKWIPLAKRKASWIEVEHWIRNYPEINIGIITGKISNLIVIDIDHRYDDSNNLNIEIDPKIITPEVITSRGNHLYFRVNKKTKSGELKTPSGKEIGEISADYRYVLAPTSTHPTGKIYNWSESKNIINQKLFEYENIKFIENENKDKIIMTTSNICNLSSNNSENNKKTTVDKNNNSNNKSHSKWWHKLQTEFTVAQEIFELAGVEVEKLGKSFRCPFHEDKHASVSLYQLSKDKLYKTQSPNNAIYFSDFHKKGRDKYFDPEKDQNKYMQPNGSKQQWYNLAEVFFAIETDRELQKLDPGVGVVWWLRAIHKLGYIDNLPIIAAKKLPEINNSVYRFKEKKEPYAIQKKSVEKVYNGFIYLLQLKTIYDQNQKGTTYSYRFISGWCGVSKTTASKAMKYLMQNRFIKVIKRTPGRKANILDLNRN